MNKDNSTAYVTDDLDQKLVSFPCFEPAGLVLDVSVRDMLRHMLLIGQTGAGKTTILNRIVRDLIYYRDQQGRGMGMLVLDSQGDATVEKIRQMAAEAGRLDDICVLSETEGFIDPIGNLNSFADLDLTVSTLTSASKSAHPSDGNHAYWAETSRLMIESALTILLVIEEHVAFHNAFEFMSDLLLLGAKSKEVDFKLSTFRKMIAKANSRLSPGIYSKLRMVDAALNTWSGLEDRTRSILKTCIAATLAPFLSAQAVRYWDHTKGNSVHPRDALTGKIVVISTRGSSEPETAALITRLAKIEFYRAAQIRTCVDQISALIMDELPLAVTSGSSRWSDVSNLATLRGKGITVVAATQGLSNLDLVIDPVVTKALVVNFSNLILLRSQEFGPLYGFAEKLFGSKPITQDLRRNPSEASDLLQIQVSISRGSEMVCPEGALARLEPHQAYVALANGFRTLTPLWLCPLYFDITSRDVPVTHSDPDLEILKRTIEPKARVSWEVTSALSLYHMLMAKPPRDINNISIRDFQLRMTKLGHRLKPRHILTIPPAWRRACLSLAEKLPSGIQIQELRGRNGILYVLFDGQDQPKLNLLQAAWRNSVYPSALRLPTRRDYHWLISIYPRLRGSSTTNGRPGPDDQS